jgi:hypothetical protein
MSSASGTLHACYTVSHGIMSPESDNEENVLNNLTSHHTFAYQAALRTGNISTLKMTGENYA